MSWALDAHYFLFYNDGQKNTCLSFTNYRCCSTPTLLSWFKNTDTQDGTCGSSPYQICHSWWHSLCLFLSPVHVKDRVLNPSGSDLLFPHILRSPVWRWESGLVPLLLLCLPDPSDGECPSSWSRNWLLSFIVITTPFILTWFDWLRSDCQEVYCALAGWISQQNH